MDDAEIYTRLTGVFESVFFDQVTLRPEMTANDLDGWDSMTHINLIVAAETEFSMRFETSELESLDSVGDMAAVIRRKGR